jgi:hypothetical protein
LADRAAPAFIEFAKKSPDILTDIFVGAWKLQWGFIKGWNKGLLGLGKAGIKGIYEVNKAVIMKGPGIIKDVAVNAGKLIYGVAKGLFNTYTGLIGKAASFISDKFAAAANFLMEKLSPAMDFVANLGTKIMAVFDSIKQTILGTTYQMIANIPGIGKGFAASNLGAAWKEAAYVPQGGATTVTGKTGAMSTTGKVTLEIDLAKNMAEYDRLRAGALA